MLPPQSPERVKFDALMAEVPDVVAAITENGKYLAKDTLARNILGQKGSKFTFEVLQKGGIVVVDLSRVRMFPTRMTPLVRLYVALARVRGKAESPIGIYAHDCLRYLPVDDFETMLLDRSVAFTFSDTSHGEEEHTLREKALQRSGSVIAFSPHEMDFEIVEKTFYPYVAPEEFEKLDDGECVAALAIDGARSRPFFAKLLPLSERTGFSPRDLELESRTKYTVSRLQADDFFRPPKEGEKEKIDKPAEAGSFSDAFRSIFSKRADAGAGDKASKTDPKAPKPAKESKQSSKAPEEKKRTEEMSEEELKKMLHVGRTPK